MGVDFSMRCCAPVSDKGCKVVSSLEHKGERVGFTERYSIIQQLLRPDGLRLLGSDYWDEESQREWEEFAQKHELRERIEKWRGERRRGWEGWLQKQMEKYREKWEGRERLTEEDMLEIAGEMLMGLDLVTVKEMVALMAALREKNRTCRWNSLRELLDKPVSFEFYDKMSGFAYEFPQIVPRECCFDPKAVLEALEALQEAIQKYDSQLPTRFYWIVHRLDGTSMEMGYEGQSLSVLWKGKSYRLNVDWSKCYLEAPDGKYVDLRGLKSEDLEMQDEDGKPVGRVEIFKQSFKECFFGYLSEMIEVCRTALRHSWLIFTHIW